MRAGACIAGSYLTDIQVCCVVYKGGDAAVKPARDSGCCRLRARTVGIRGAPHITVSRHMHRGWHTHGACTHYTQVMLSFTVTTIVIKVITMTVTTMICKNCFSADDELGMHRGWDTQSACRRVMKCG